MISTDVDTTGARVSVETLYWASDNIRKGALNKVVLDAAADHLELKFLKHMTTLAHTSEGKAISHVFDYTPDGEGVGLPLWKIIKAGTGKRVVITYAFRESTEYVPIPAELKGNNSRHVFRKKAEIFESGEGVIIARKPGTKWLKYINRQAGAGEVEKDQAGFAGKNGTTYHKGPSYIYKSGNYKHKNQFDNVFFTWWTSQAGAGADLKELELRLTRQTAIQMARFAGAKRRITSLKGTQSRKDVTPEAKKRAAETIEAIKRQWRKDQRDKL